MIRVPVLFHASGVGLSLHDLVSLGVIAFVITTASIQILGSLLQRRGRLGPADRPVDFARWAPAVAAACSLGAATIHLAVIGDHLDEYVPFGVAFAALAAFQIAWPIAYVVRPARVLAALAVLTNLGTAAVWLWSRTLGLPIGPDAGVPAGIGTADVVSTVLELVLVAVLVVAASPATRRPRLGLPATAVLVAGGYAVGAVALATTVALLSLGGAA